MQEHHGASVDQALTQGYCPHTDPMFAGSLVEFGLFFSIWKSLYSFFLNFPKEMCIFTFVIRKVTKAVPQAEGF